MKKEIIVFDKDGTLLDFDAFWVSVSVAALSDILKKLNKEEIGVDEFLTAFGVKDGVTDIDGILCKGTYEQMGLAVYDILKKYGCNETSEGIISMLIQAYNENSDKGQIKPTCENIKEVLSALKSDGRKLIVVTTDNYEITEKCLEALGISEYFECIFADDGKTPTKPDPKCILDYTEKSGIAIDKAVMVGDTMTDVNFARNAGMSVIGVGSTDTNRQRLTAHADIVINSIADICDALKELETL